MTNMFCISYNDLYGIQHIFQQYMDINPNKNMFLFILQNSDSNAQF